MKLYLAGPMTGYYRENRPAFQAEAARLRALGFEVVSPDELNPEGCGRDWLTCMRIDIKHAVDCDGIALLDGWEQSRGAPIEHCVIRGLGLCVFRAKHLIGVAGDLPVLSSGAIALEAA